MKTLRFKNAIKKLGYEVVKYNKGFNYRSAFALDNDGQMWYFNIEDLRDANPTVFRRKVKDANDYHGETNLYDVNGMLNSLGYRILEPRTNSDYNSL